MNIQTIKELSSKAFPARTVVEYKKFNKDHLLDNVDSYLVTFDDGFKAILKTERSKSHLLRNNFDPITTEKEVFYIINNKPTLKIKIPDLYFFDDTKTSFSKKYLFTEYFGLLDYEKQMASLPKEKKERIDYKSGKVVKKLMDTLSPTFRLLVDSKHQFTELFDFVFFLLNNVISDAHKRNVDLSIQSAELNALLEKDRKCFECSTEPCLVHLNMQPHNILVNDDEIYSIINWENAVFGDPLMEVRFRLQKYTLAFLDGFGQSQFNFKETRRLLWYDIIYYLSVMVKCGSSKANQIHYENAKKLIQQCMMMLQFTF
jgi:hypothetical protein